MKTTSIFFVVCVASNVAGQDTLQDLVKKLGDAKFAVREKTQQQLSEKIMADFGVFTTLKEKLKKEPDAEIRRRIDALLDLPSTWRLKYQVDLRGYKDYPQMSEGMPGDFTLHYGKWSMWYKKDFLSYYLGLANLFPSPEDNDSFKWAFCRRAMKIFVEERIDYEFEQCYKTSRNISQLDTMMQKKMSVVQKDLDEAIVLDKKWYQKNNYKNPFLEEKKRP